MPVEQVLDDAGDSMTLIRYEHDRYGASDFVEDSLLRMRETPLREDDILLCSYSKSGCHWVWEMLRALQLGTTDLGVVRKEDFMMEYNSLETLAAAPSPRVLNNHIHWSAQPRDLIAKKVKVVFVYRNPRDVAVSFFHHHRKFSDYDYRGNFDNYLRRLVQGKVDNGSPFRYLREWEQGMKSNPDLPVFLARYEDMKQDPLSELRRLSKFLGHSYSDAFLEAVVTFTSFDSMKARKSCVSFHDADGESIMYRKGEVGDWKNFFSPDQLEWFQRLTTDEMTGSSFRFRYSLED